MKVINVFILPARAYIEIISFTPLSSQITDYCGNRPEPSVILGRRIFSVDVVETDGSREVIWNGHSRADAEDAARAAARAWGISSVRDRTLIAENAT